MQVTLTVFVPTSTILLVGHLYRDNGRKHLVFFSIFDFGIPGYAIWSATQLALIWADLNN